MTEGWQEVIDAAQLEPTATLNGKVYTRIRYGAEIDPPNPKPTCADCGCSIGQFHVVNCDVERCACCDGQFIGCVCDRDD